MPRGTPGDLIHDADEASRPRLLGFLQSGMMPTVGGAPIALDRPFDLHPWRQSRRRAHCRKAAAGTGHRRHCSSAVPWMSDDRPIILPVGDQGLTVSFGDRVDARIHGRVLALDRAIAASPFPGFTEAVPAFSSLFVGYDPLKTDPDTVRRSIERLLDTPVVTPPTPRLHTLTVHYGGDHSPDLEAIAEATGLAPEAVIAEHLKATYRVYLYGFAPGYAYLDGTRPPIQVPRRPSPVRGRPAGSVMIAGSQCIVTTVEMPTGWWVVGRCFARILDVDGPRPFLFELGDEVRFIRAGAEDEPA